MREVVFFDNYDVLGAYRDAREALVERHSLDSPDDGWEPSESEVRDEASFREREAWEEMEERIGEILPPVVLVTGSSGMWNGRSPGGKVYISPKAGDIIGDVGRGCDYFKVYRDGHNVLCIDCTHHDGTNYYEIREVTDAGYVAYEDWCRGRRFREDSEQDIHERLWNSRRYTRNVKVSA